MQKQVLENLSSEEKINLAGNPKTSSVLLEFLSHDKDSILRSIVAANPSTPLETLESLSKEKDYVIREGVGLNPNISSEIIRGLSKDPDPFVRLALTSNKKTTSDILQELSKDKNVLVRKGVAKNTKTPLKALHALSKDRFSDVRKAVHNNPVTPKELRDLIRKKEERITKHPEKSHYHDSSANPLKAFIVSFFNSYRYYSQKANVFIHSFFERKRTQESLNHPQHPSERYFSINKKFKVNDKHPERGEIPAEKHSYQHAYKANKQDEKSITKKKGLKI